MFDIFVMVPSFNDYDAITGYEARKVNDYSYHTYELAARLSREWDSEGMDETYVRVVPCGTSPFQNYYPASRRPAMAALDGDIPF